MLSAFLVCSIEFDLNNVVVYFLFLSVIGIVSILFRFFFFIFVVFSSICDSNKQSIA